MGDSELARANEGRIECEFLIEDCRLIYLPFSATDKQALGGN